MILFFILWYILVSIQVESLVITPIITLIIIFFVWLGLSIYLLKNKETRIHGIILLTIWLILLALTVIVIFNFTSHTGCSKYFYFEENLASNLDNAIKILETKYESNITTREITTDVIDKNGKTVKKTIYMVDEYPAALDSEGNLYSPPICY